MDFKYLGIRIAQKTILISNLLETIFIKNKKISLSGNEKILIIKCDRIGDAIWCIHFCKVLKANFPNISIDIVSNKYNEFIFLEHKELFENLYSLKIDPPKDFLKNILKRNIFSGLNILIKNKVFWKNIKANKYDYIFNLTGRTYFFVSKYLGKNIGGRMGLLNFLYNFPILKHPEIGNDKHIVFQWLEKIENINTDISTCNNNHINNYNNKVILFIGGKEPGRLSKDFYEKIIYGLKSENIDIETLDDKNNEKADFTITKGDNGLFVGEKTLKEFIKDYDLFIGIDGGILHYASQYLPTFSFYLCTNHKIAHPFCGQILENKYSNQVRFYKTKYGKNILVSSELDCIGCFKIGCKNQKCKQLLDKKSEIVIKEIKSNLKLG